jgi:hypothetical protein
MGQLRRVNKPTANGVGISEWVGKHSFVKDLSTPARRVMGFMTPHGFMNTSGRYLHDR